MVAFGFAKPYSVDNRGVVEGVGYDSVFFGKEGFEYTSVSVEAGGVEYGIFGFEVAGDCFFEFAMQVLCPADESNRRHTESMRIH